MTATGSRWARSAGAYTPSRVEAIHPAGIGVGVGEVLIEGDGESVAGAEDDGDEKGESDGQALGVSPGMPLGVAPGVALAWEVPPEALMSSKLATRNVTTTIAGMAIARARWLVQMR